MAERTVGISARALLTAYYALASVFLAAYIVIYQVAPFEGLLNDYVLNALIALGAFLAALFSSAVAAHYHPEDRPRRVWVNLTLGSWLWFISETIWAAIYYELGEVPTPNLADIGWALGYVFFSLAIYHQYALIWPAEKKRMRTIIYLTWLVVLLIPLLVSFALSMISLENYVNYFYPFADLAVGMAGLIFVYYFRGGMLVRPWLGMVIFSVSDFVYAWAIQTGLYQWSVDNGNPLTLFVDSSYFFSYLFFAWGVLTHWILLRYGLPAERQPQ